MLGMIESLLCGASAGKMKNEKLDADIVERHFKCKLILQII